MATDVDFWITQQITSGALVAINCGLGTYVRLIMVSLCHKLLSIGLPLKYFHNLCTTTTMIWFIKRFINNAVNKLKLKKNTLYLTCFFL